MIVVVHGYEGSGPGHWQHWLTEELTKRGEPVFFPDLPDPVTPDRDAWVRSLDALVATQTAPVTFVAHSLGCWAVDHFLARRGSGGVHAALLVAPPSSFSLFEPIQSFLPPAFAKSAFASLAGRTLLLGSDDDDYASEDEFAEAAEALGVPFRSLPGMGHLNAASGLGPFPLVLEWLRDVGALTHR